VRVRVSMAGGAPRQAQVLRERSPGFPRPREAKNFEPFFVGGCQEADAKRRTEEEEEEEEE